MTTSILAISTSLPSHATDQMQVAEIFIEMLSLNAEQSSSLRQLYLNSAIQTRYSVIPDYSGKRSERDFFAPNFPEKVPGMSQRNDLYKLEAPKLALDAATKVLKSWGGDPESITHIISVSCTGLIAPGIEFILMKLLNLKSSVQRLGINFMGCFGAFKGLSVARAFAKENPNHRIMVVCTELCSLHFQAEFTSDNILGNSLFSDGAAAVIVGANPKDSESCIWDLCEQSCIGLDNTADKITWEANDNGLMMKLSNKVPALLKRHIAPFVHSLIGSNFARNECNWAIHPGGKSIIQAIEKALELDAGLTLASWDTLRDYGNMSSASFLFVLNRLLEQNNTKKWTVGLGFGPGLAVEGIVLRRSGKA